MLKKIEKAAKKYIQFKQYLDELEYNKFNQQNAVVGFDINKTVEQEILAQKEAKRKARNKRKAGKR